MSFQKLLTQAGSDAERQRLLDLRLRSGLDDDDPAWTFPFLLEDAVQRVERATAGAEKMAEAAATNAAVRAKEMVTRSITSQVDMRTFNVQHKRSMIWLYGGTTGAILVSMIVGWIVFSGMSQRSMEALATSVASAARDQMISALNATVATEVARVLQTGTEHQAEVVNLLRKESATPGLLAYALWPNVLSLMQAEQRQPGITEYASSMDGMFAYRMYQRNDRHRCRIEHRENIEGTVTNVCVNLAPRIEP